MNKVSLIIKREYLTRVRKKSFLLTTILVPLVIIGFYAAIIAIAMSDSSDKERIAIVDKANLFEGKVPPDKDGKQSIEFNFVQNETEESFKKKYDSLDYSAFLYIPETDINKPSGIRLHSQKTLSIGTQSKIDRKVNKAIEQKRLTSANIPPDKYESIKSDIDIPTIIDSGDGEKTGAEGAARLMAIALGMLIYIVLLIYGSMVMRGVMEEKMNRISEVIVSSVKPFQLMLGKIIGIGAVGITQFLIWIVLIAVLTSVLPAFGPDMAKQIADDGTGAMNEAAKASVVAEITQGLKSLPIGLILFTFLFYFIGGYLVYASLFAAIGSVSEDLQDAQQLMFPVMMPIILGFVILTKAMQEPNGGLALFGSMFPLTSPIVMIGRIPFGVPIWELLASMAILVLFFLFCTWLAGRIYRTGILMYGKKGSWKEMVKWAFKRY
jgi:ABC-2 type transport system permease protein